MLLVPVDAAVLMEPTSAAQLRAVPSILTTPEVGEVVRQWLKERNWRPDEPALLMLCPVKCESYFDDNGGRRDEGEELLSRVRRVYADVIEAVPAEAPHVRVVYAPVDTIGCVEILHAEWTPDPREPSGLAFAAHYGVRWPARQAVKGADDVLISLCKHLVAAQQRVESDIAGEKRSRRGPGARVRRARRGVHPQHLVPPQRRAGPPRAHRAGEQPPRGRGGRPGVGAGRTSSPTSPAATRAAASASGDGAVVTAQW